MADDGQEQVGDANQDLVAGLVPVLVVDVLEVVEVEDRQGEGLGGILEPAREVAAIVETGEPVAVRLLAELLLERLELGRA
jgi:hypothetical protein